MSHKKLQTWQKATALVPLALLSCAWTASLSVTSTATAAAEPQPLPDGSTVPTQAIKAPASVSQPGEIAPGVPAGAATSVVSSASTNGIPSAALIAYQRASEVINSADPTCKIGWQLIAAIGRVESDHGRYGGNTLSTEGKSVPGIYGIPLDGSNGTARITDTDAGQYDNDQVYDRAVGPMQFIPATWAVVGVDADGDDVRDPQDIDDAALASAVYLCSGNEDLSSVAGQRSSVYRYNHSEDYVDLVLSIMNAYARGDYASVPNGVSAPTVFTPAATGSDGSTPPSKKKPASGKGGSGKGGSNTGSGDNGGGSGGETGGGADSPAPEIPTGGGGGGNDPVQEPADDVEDTTDDVKQTLSALDKAKITCQENFTAAEINQLGGLTACGNAILSDGLGGVQSTLDDIVDDVTGGLLN